MADENKDLNLTELMYYISVYYKAYGLDYNIPLDNYIAKYKIEESEAVKLAFLSIRIMSLI